MIEIKAYNYSVSVFK